MNPRSNRLSDAFLADLRAIVGAERVSTAGAARETHGRGESYHPAEPPDAVMFAANAQEVQRIVVLCAERRVPVIPYGAGTSLEGHLAAVQGGISLDLSAMNAVLRVSADDMDVTVQPGVRRKRLNEHLRDTGLFFPIDPGADASIGGMASTRASGTNTVRYGTMSENVLNLQVVLPNGEIIETGTRARKSAAGYELTKLFVGSEGTLGVFTEITLRVYGIPAAISSAVVSFPDLESAVRAVMLTIQTGVPVARIELLDEVVIDACNRYSKLDYPIQPTLFMEFHGSEAAVAEQAEAVGAICWDYGGGDFNWATRLEDRNRLWTARDNTLYAGLALRPGSKAMITDVCVPISRLAECILETRKDLDGSSLTAPIVGHVGDGNFHLLILVEPGNAVELEEAERLNGRLVRRALSLGGTCTGEHGVGIGKMGYLLKERGPAVAVMRSLKQAIDPLNIMNLGKIFDGAD